MELIKYKQISKNYIEVTESYTYKDITVPKGFISNGASIPKPLQFIYSPFDNRYLTSCIIHDYLYKTHQYSRYKSDKTLYKLMRLQNNPKPLSHLFYKSVRIFGKQHH